MNSRLPSRFCGGGSERPTRAATQPLQALRARENSNPPGSGTSWEARPPRRPQSEGTRAGVGRPGQLGGAHEFRRHIFEVEKHLFARNCPLVCQFSSRNQPCPLTSESLASFRTPAPQSGVQFQRQKHTSRGARIVQSGSPTAVSPRSVAQSLNFLSAMGPTPRAAACWSQAPGSQAVAGHAVFGLVGTDADRPMSLGPAFEARYPSIGIFPACCSC